MELPRHATLIRRRVSRLGLDRTFLEEHRLLQSRFEYFVEQVKDCAIFMLDAKGNVATWNQGAARLKGYQAGEILGRPFSVFFPREEVEADKPARELSHAASFGTFQEEGWRIRKDGSRFMASVSITALRGDRGEITGFLKVTRDITMQRDAEERLLAFARELEGTVAERTRELRENQARLEGFIRFATSAIAFQDAGGRYLLLNPSMEAFLGLDRGAILGRTDRELREMPEGPTDEEKVLASGQPLEVEVRRPHPDGSAHDYLCQKFPLIDAEGSNWGVGILATDITERKRVEQVRLQSQKLESLGILAGGIAHDFNNLLGAILGNLGLAQMETSATAPVRLRLETMEALVTKATSLTRQLLAYSGRGTFEVRSLDLNHLVEEMTHLLGISIAKKVELAFRLEPALPAIIADASQLQQVVMNLVINASDAIGDASGTITVRTASVSEDTDDLARTFQGQGLPPGTYVSLEVADDGAGMTPEVLGRIFEPFFTTKFSGRGLGLSAIQGIVKGHGGAIRVDSEPGRGTTFRIFFPAAGTAEAARSEPAPETGFRGSGTILVVDDEESIRTMAAGILTQLGFQTLLASDGMEALMVLEANKNSIRLVIMDLTMPHMDGAEAFAALRARGHACPVVLSSGFNESEAVKRFQDQGLAGFLQKPYKVAAFVQAVRRALAGTSQ